MRSPTTSSPTSCFLDGSARLNLATFVTTWMPPHAAQPDGGDGRQEHDRQGRVPADGRARAPLREHPRRPLARARATATCTGTSTTGSSEAAMLGGMALKWRWRERMTRRRQADRPAQHGDGRQRPGVLGQVLPLLGGRAAARADGGRALPPRRPSRPPRTATRTRSASSRSSARRSTAATSRSRRSARRSTRWPPTAAPTSPLHVDAASGGFIAPFVQPDLVWDFRLPRVQSINASGHKYGLVYPGVGWAIWRDAEALPERPRVQRQLPRRRHADVRAELLAARQRGRSRSTSCSCSLGLDGLRGGAAGLERRRAAHRRRGRGDRARTG